MLETKWKEGDAGDGGIQRERGAGRKTLDIWRDLI